MTEAEIIPQEKPIQDKPIKEKPLYLKVRGCAGVDRIQKVVTVPKESSIRVGDTIKVIKVED